MNNTFDSTYVAQSPGWSLSLPSNLEHVHTSVYDVAGETVVRDTGSYDWVVVLVLSMFIVLALIFHKDYRIISQRLSHFFKRERVFLGGQSDKHVGEIRNTLLLTGVSSICIGLMLVDMLSKTPDVVRLKFTHQSLVLIIAASCMVFIALRAFIYNIVNWTFFDSESVRKWMSAFMFINSLQAFIIFPIMLLSVFIPLQYNFMIICLVIVLILYELMLFFKLNINFRTKKYGYMLIFLYFCSVELMPVLVLGHFFQKLGIQFN